MSTQSNTEVDEIELPKTTIVTFHDPDQSSLPISYEGDETMAAEHFEAVPYINEELGPARNRSFGEIADGLQQLEEDGDPSRLLAIYTKIVTPKSRRTNRDIELGGR